jgi:hypothetical protein
MDTTRISTNSVKIRARPYVGRLTNGEREMLNFATRPNGFSHPQYDQIYGPFNSVGAARIFIEDSSLSTVAQVMRKMKNMRKQQAARHVVTEAHPS